jgi:hypothetical protein
MNFGLICEGDTDYPVILNLLAGYFDDRNIELNPVQPKTKESGGWTRIFSFCSSERFMQALELNDYLVIQIDTDRRMDKGFDIHEYKNTADLFDKVKQKIIEQITPPLYETVKDKIIFAVSVHSIECWLLPFYANVKADQARENNCFKTINSILASKAGNGLNKKYIKTYFDASKPLSKSFHQKKKLQESLFIFSKELDIKFKEQA